MKAASERTGEAAVAGAAPRSAQAVAIGLPPELDQVSARLRQYERRISFLPEQIECAATGEWRDKLKASLNRAIHGAQVCRDVIAQNAQRSGGGKEAR
jgi:hypothetical protein